MCGLVWGGSFKSGEAASGNASYLTLRNFRRSLNFMTRMSLTLFCLLCILNTSGSSAASFPASSSEQTRILIPVLARGTAGADGSVWDTEIWVTNRTDFPIVYFFGTCQVACCCEEINTIHPQRSFVVTLNELRGRWFTLPADGSLQFQARLRDRTRAGSSAGVELPIVREQDFRTGEANLLGIPRDPRFRAMVRLYAFNAGVWLRVEQVDQNGAVLHHDDVALEPPAVPSFSKPAYAQVPLFLDTSGYWPIRIRIRSLTEGARFWAFASVTNNETSEVTIIQPWW